MVQHNHFMVQNQINDTSQCFQSMDEQELIDLIDDPDNPDDPDHIYTTFRQ